MQNDNWLEWRQGGIGSSDAPIIAGVSPYSTPYKLWEYKTNRRKAWDGNWATRRGHAVEPKARADYEFTYDRDMPATLVQHPQFPWMRSSLDGWDSKERIVLEIKCPGKVDHDLALNGSVPEKYYPQLQHQIFVSSANRVDYWSFDGERGVCVPVYFDKEWFKSYWVKALEFWQNVQNDIPPVLVDRDWKLVRNKLLRQELELWHSASLVNGEQAVYLEARIFEVFVLDDRRMRCAGFYLDGSTKKISIGGQPQTQQLLPSEHHPT